MCCIGLVGAIRLLLTFALLVVRPADLAEDHDHTPVHYQSASGRRRRRDAVPPGPLGRAATGPLHRAVRTRCGPVRVIIALLRAVRIGRLEREDGRNQLVSLVLRPTNVASRAIDARRHATVRPPVASDADIKHGRNAVRAGADSTVAASMRRTRLGAFARGSTHCVPGVARDTVDWVPGRVAQVSPPPSSKHSGPERRSTMRARAGWAAR